MTSRVQFPIDPLSRPSGRHWLRLSSARRTKHRQKYGARRERDAGARMHLPYYDERA